MLGWVLLQCLLYTHTASLPPASYRYQTPAWDWLRHGFRYDLASIAFWTCVATAIAISAAQIPIRGHLPSPRLASAIALAITVALVHRDRTSPSGRLPGWPAGISHGWEHYQGWHERSNAAVVVSGLLAPIVDFGLVWLLAFTACKAITGSRAIVPAQGAPPSKPPSREVRLAAVATTAFLLWLVSMVATNAVLGRAGDVPGWLGCMLPTLAIGAAGAGAALYMPGDGFRCRLRIVAAAVATIAVLTLWQWLSWRGLVPTGADTVLDGHPFSAPQSVAGTSGAAFTWAAVTTSIPAVVAFPCLVFCESLSARIMLALAILLAANGVDAAATWVGIASHRVAEANPVVRLVGFGAKLAVVTVGALLIWRHRPRLLWPLALVLLCVVAYHAAGLVIGR